METYLRESFSHREMGNCLKKSHSTLRREFRRNRTRGSHYIPEVDLANLHSSLR
nr:hypothetical protein [Alteromonas sp. KUL150]